MSSEGGLTGDEIRMDVERVWCASHGEPFRTAEISTRVIQSIAIFQAAAENERLWALCREAQGIGPEEKPHPRSINAITERLPLCYFVSDDVLRKTYGDSGVTSIARCQSCGQLTLGVPYSTTTYGQVVERWACLECVLHMGAAEHRRHPTGRSLAARRG